MTPRLIPVDRLQTGTQELEYLRDCVESGWISSSGPFLSQFEARWAAYCGRTHGVAVSSGTAALQLAVRSLDLQPGDEVIVPTFTIVSCALAVIYSGGVPVLVDSIEHDGCLDVRQVEARVTPRTRAILAVDMYGHPADFDPLLQLAERHGLVLIEDAAQAHGAEYLSRRDGQPRWRRCGSFGHMSCFSFYANKAITTGEGGMVLVDDEATAQRLASLRNLAFHPGRRFHHEELGFNFRMTNLQAAVGLAQVERIERIIARKRWIAEQYRSKLGALPGVAQPREAPDARSIFWTYGLLLDGSRPGGARQLGQDLLAQGIETRPYFLGLHEQPALRERGLFFGEAYPVAERLAREGLYLPSGLGLTEAELERVTVVVRELLGGSRG